MKNVAIKSALVVLLLTVAASNVFASADTKSLEQKSEKFAVALLACNYKAAEELISESAMGSTLTEEKFVALGHGLTEALGQFRSLSTVSSEPVEGGTKVTYLCTFEYTKARMIVTYTASDKVSNIVVKPVSE